MVVESAGIRDDSVNYTKPFALVGEMSVDLMAHFRTDRYIRYNSRRFEFLARLDLPVQGKSVIEFGAGIGDVATFFLDRGCVVTSTDGRAENVAAICQCLPQVKAFVLDLDAPTFDSPGVFDIVSALGILYHLANPEGAIARMASCCREMMIVETCVSGGSDIAANFCSESTDDPTQALDGTGCRPTRPWVYNALKRHFPFVYVPTSQPWHEEFPTDWNNPAPTHYGLMRSFFFASRQPIVHLELTASLPMFQTRR